MDGHEGQQHQTWRRGSPLRRGVLFLTKQTVKDVYKGRLLKKDWKRIGKLMETSWKAIGKLLESYWKPSIRTPDDIPLRWLVFTG